MLLQDLGAALEFIRCFPEAQSHKILLLTEDKSAAVVNRPQASTELVYSELNRR